MSRANAERSTHQLFKNFHPSVLVKAVLRGDKWVTQFILFVNPDLLKEINSATDFSGREFKGTALQAAIACGDFAPNENSTGLFELIVEKLKEQYPDHWHQLFHDQTLELYTKSLRVYAKKQSEKIHDLYERIGNGKKIDLKVIKAEEKRLEAYDRALHSNDLTTIINAHTNPDPDPTNTKACDAQKDHVFQMDPALINAIAIATDTEIQAVLDNPKINSPLSNLLKQFRADFTKLSHEEIIFNPQHLIKIFMLHDEFYDRVERTDPNWKKRDLFRCHLVGYVQRYFPANIAQIFANPGLFDTVEKNMKNARRFHFKIGGGPIFPLSFDSNSGLGYKFSMLVSGGGSRNGYGRMATVGAVPTFSKLMSNKNSKLSRLIRSIRDSGKEPMYNSVM